MILGRGEIEYLIGKGYLVDVGENRRCMGTSVGIDSYGITLPLGNKWAKNKPNSEIGDGTSVIDLSLLVSEAKIETEEFISRSCLLNPSGFVLNLCPHYFNMPDDVIGIDCGKSTMARIGIKTMCSPAEPSWRGYYLLEIYNNGEFPVMLHEGQGITQMVFIRGPHTSKYSGKYQNQLGVTGATA